MLEGSSKTTILVFVEINLIWLLVTAKSWRWLHLEERRLADVTLLDFSTWPGPEVRGCSGGSL